LNILHVEDEIDWFERIVRPALNEIGAKSVSHAISYSKAIEIINSKNIDYIILDLAIPKDDENPTADISNGLKLASYIRVNYPGTPLLILTGQQTEEAVEQFVEDEEVTIFWNGKARSLVKVRPKRSLDKVIDLLKDAVE
jgi:CheY-like chemotaxis protein